MPADSSKRPSRVPLIAAVVVVLLGIAFQFFRRDDAPEPEAKVAVVEEERVATVLSEPELVERRPRRDASLPFEPRPTRVERAADETVPVEDMSLAQLLEGEWRAIMRAEGAENEVGTTALALDEEAGLIHVSNEALHTFGELRLEGNQVVVALDDPDTEGELRGWFNDAFDELSLEGVVRDERRDFALTVELLFVKVDETYRMRQIALQSARDSMKTVLSALKRYAADHDGTLPATLDELYPDYVQDAGVLDDAIDSGMEYDPSVASLPPVPEIDWKALDSAEALIAAERELESYWGVELLDPTPVLSMEIEGVVFHGSILHGVSQEESSDSFENYAGSDANLQQAQWAAQRASCANNLKQLGLVSKMFQNEVRGERYPPGPFITYPEYMANPAVLTCPSVEAGTWSYEHLFPAATDAELDALYTEVTGETQQGGTNIPFMIESHLCAGDLGHNVLFLDGHVEFLTPERFEEQVEPFLAVRLR